jgi:hypothetical protein
VVVCHNGVSAWQAWKDDRVVEYALWDLVTETLLDEGEDPARILETMQELRATISPDIVPVFGLTEYHPALQTHSSVSGEDAVLAHLEKRVAARRRRNEGAS